MKRQHFGVRRSAEHGEQIHLAGFRQITPQSSALRGPRDFQTPGRSEFAREQGFCLRQKRLDAPKGAGPLRGPSAICRDSCFKFECSIIRTWKTNPSDWSPADHPTKLRFAGTPGFQNSRAKSIRPGARFLPPAKTLGRAIRRGAAPRPFGDLPGLYFKLEGALIQTWRTNPSGWFRANRRRPPHPLTARCGFWRPSGRRRTPLRWK